MRANEFVDWLIQMGYPQNQITANLNRCARIDRYEGDLDAAFGRDGCRALMERLIYAAADERLRLPPRHNIPIVGCVRSGTASLKSALGLYVSFCRGENRWYESGVAHNRANHRRGRLDIVVESYQRFFREFGIDEERLIRFGIQECIFSELDQAWNNWRELVRKLESPADGDVLYIRHDGSGLFVEFYHQLFRNSRIEEDRDGNTAPIDALAAATRRTTRNHHECVRLENYVLSHVFDERTMNPLLFGGVYNFAFTPTFIDPFTGKAKGAFAKRFRREFRLEAIRRFRSIYDEFKRFAQDHHVQERIDEFVQQQQGLVRQRTLNDFRRRAMRAWDPQFEVPEND